MQGLSPLEAGGLSSRARTGWKPVLLSHFFAVVVLAVASPAWAIERFPPPDFTSHQLPPTTTPEPSWLGWEYLDTAFLVAALALATYFALVRRSRRALFGLSLVSLAWLGFWRSGCVCPIGAIQNVTLAAVDPAYAIPFSVVVFFSLPLVFALFFGRTFCAAVCPLGAVQELVAVRPVKVPAWVDHALGLLPYVYLGGAVLFAATQTTFLICNYDPFVGFFRLSASASMLVFGACFLVIGFFVGRPYCRYLCPYGALLGLCSKVSKRHVRIPPEECIKCRLCEDACPYGAIQAPTVDQTARERLEGRRRLALLLVLFPLLVAAGAWIGRAMAVPLSRLHATAALAERVRLEETGDVEGTVDASDAFRNTGRPAKELYAEALALQHRFGVAGAWFGAWIGLVIGAKLVHLSIRRRRSEYQPDKANCVSCGRCFWYCPAEQARRGWIETTATAQPPAVGQAFQPDNSGRQAGKPDSPRRQAGKPDLRVARNERWARTALQTAVVAAVFVLAATSLLAWDYSRRVAKDPLNSETFKALKADLAAQPQNEALTAKVRELDRLLRSQYFTERRFASAGGWVLLVGTAVFLIALRAAATLRRRLPQPEGLPVPAPADTRSASHARWAVGGLAVLLAIAGLGMALGVGTVLREAGEEPAGTAAASTSSGIEPAIVAAAKPETAPAARSAVAPVAASAGSDSSNDENAKYWPRFRGPMGLGVSAYTNVPTTWDGPSGKNIVWKTAVPVEGNGSPVVWKDRIFLTGATDRVRQVYCFDTGGKLLWQKDMPATPSAAAKPPEVIGDAGYASSTSAADGQRVYVMFAIGDVAAFDFSGKLVWVRSLGIPKNSYGHATSLAMVRNLLLVQFDQAMAKDAKSKLLALDAATGNPVWETPRPVPNSWCTPIVIRWKGQEQIVTAGDPWVIAYQPADGKEIWRAKCLGQDVAASPVFSDGVVYVGNANAKMSAIRIDGRGDVTESHVLWTAEDGLPDTCSPLAAPQGVLLLTSSGTLTSYDPKSGKKLWEKEFDASFKASPTLAGKNVYLLSDEGKAWIVEPSSGECKIVAEANLGEPCAASPAFQDGRIYVRGKQHLFCIGSK